MDPQWLWFPLIGIPAGFIAGLLGIGGGVIVTPALLAVFSLFGWADYPIAHMAIATSLATIIITSLGSTWQHHKNRSIDWILVRNLLVGIAIGSMIGVNIADKLSGDTLMRAFSIYLMMATARLLYSPQTSHTTSNQPVRLSFPLSTGIGAGVSTLSALFGIGGGTVAVPLLSHYKVPIRQAVGTSAACGIPVAFVGGVSYIIAGWSHDMPDYSLGYVFLPAWLGIISTSVVSARLGAHFSHRVPTQILKRFFACLLIVIAIKLFISP